MNKIALLFIAAILLLGGTVQAQHAICGTGYSPEMMQRLLANKKAIADSPATFRNGDITYVPIKFHLIGKGDGSSRISEGLVLDMLCHINEEYADQDIQFYVFNGFNYIDNNAAYSNPEDVPLVMAGQKDNDAMNIYIGQKADPPNGSGLGVTLGYYSPSNDWIVIKKSEINGNSATAPHEIGHYFSLPHPFLGWDCTSWTEAEFGNPTNITTAPCSPVPVELADGSNCNTAGDMICDTPADYNLGFSDGNDCNYTGNCMDPNGNLLDPMENNFMSYFNGCADYEFTPDQKALIAADLNSRIGLDTDWQPSATEINGIPDLVAPVGGATTSGYNNVLIDWTPVDGATHYVLEIDLAANFSIIPQRFVVAGDSYWVTTLNASTTYFWRVRPFNSYVACTDKSVTGEFKTPSTTSTVEPAFVNNWTVRPNPVAQGDQLEIIIDSNENFDATIRLLTTAGQLVQMEQATFNSGTAYHTVDTRDLTAGIYLLSIQSDAGVLNRRVVIGK